MIERVLIVGMGSIGQRHARLAKVLLPKADIRILRHLATNTSAVLDFGIMSTLEEATSFAPQIAIIANPATFHLEIARTLAEAGAHILVEKPMSVSIEGISDLIELCKQRNTILSTGYNLRFSPSLRQFREILNDGKIGKILSVRCEAGKYLPSWRPFSDYRLGVSAKRELGGGALLELSHEIDYLRWIFGDVLWVRATLSKQSDLAVNVEDSALLTFGFLPNIEGHQVIGVLNLDFIRHDETRLCTVIGEYGSLRWNGITGEVELFESGAKEWRELFRHVPQPDETYIKEWENFLESVRDRTATMVTGHDGLRVVEIIEAARQSADSGIQVNVAISAQRDPSSSR